MAGLFEGGNELVGSLKAILNLNCSNERNGEPKTQSTTSFEEAIKLTGAILKNKPPGPQRRMRTPENFESEKRCCAAQAALLEDIQLHLESAIVRRPNLRSGLQLSHGQERRPEMSKDNLVALDI
ncbi:hypothetical protein ANN_08680 [Periplaneta americana]|uniref:Uncharacterized protein n=1 Tax=Periplaneta americana TaxID=6978 RepID=A0ABQ8T3A3_PERAM|nr:hypothetical protein ANN_08680 [Periplaneta americana]